MAMYERTGYQTKFKDKARDRWEKFKRGAEEKLVKAAEWTRDNWEVVSVLGAGAAMLVGKGVKAYGKHRAFVRERELKDRYIYDHSTGHYWHLNKTPRQRDLLELAERRKNSSLGEALRDMRLI